MAGTRARDRFDEPGQDRLGILIVDADPAFHGDRAGSLGLHGANAVGDRVGIFHQHRAESARLHAIRRTAAVQVHRVIAPRLCDAHRLRQRARIRPAQLQCQRMLDRAEIQQTVLRPVDDRLGGDHLGIQHRTARHAAMKDAAVPVRPVHHGRHGQSM